MAGFKREKGSRGGWEKEYGSVEEKNQQNISRQVSKTERCKFLE